MLPITIESLKKLKGAAVIPVGVASQFSINDKGQQITKRRTTHDATFPPPSEQSINNRMIRDLLADCFFGHCLLRILHQIHIMRLTHPSVCIFLSKLDIDAAYRRIHVTARMAMLAITIIKRIAYVLLRLPFGVANGPADFGIISEPIMDLTNEILRDNTFEPNELHSPLQNKFKSKQRRYNSEVPFEEARKLFVDVPFWFAAADGYIDDIISVMLDIKIGYGRGRILYH